MKYSEEILSRIFDYSSCCFSLKNPPEFYVFEHQSEKIYDFVKKHSYGSETHPLICKRTEKSEDIHCTENYLKRIHALIADIDLAHLLVAEVLSKVLSYRNLKKDQQLNIPMREGEGKLQLVSYKVNVVLNLWQDIHCYGLIPFDQDHFPPVVLFPGTDFSIVSKRGRASMLSDLDPAGPGRSLYLHARDQIKAWLEQSCKHQLVCLFGHSLGAILASYVLILENKLISKKYKSFIFNYPGIEMDMLQQWMEIDKRHKPNFLGFVSRGDIVSKYGYLFGPTYELALGTPLQPITAHTHLFFAHPVCHLSKIDINEENHSESRKQYSKLYKKTSSLFYNIGLKYFFPNN